MGRTIRRLKADPLVTVQKLAGKICGKTPPTPQKLGSQLPRPNQLLGQLYRQ